MKKLIAYVSVSFLALGAQAQGVVKPAPSVGGASTAAKAVAPRSAAAVKVRHTAIGGTFLNARREPVAKIQAYAYMNDSIKASGFTDAAGKYETSNMMPGIYTLRFVYPKSGRRITVTGIPVKLRNVTMVNYTGIEPVGDSTFTYAELMPQAPTKK